jgi:hypothetical protein
MQAEVISSVEAAASALLEAEQAWADALEALESARLHEREHAQLAHSIYAKIIAKEQALPSAETDAFTAIVYDRSEAAEKRKAVDDLRSEVAFLKRVSDRFNAYELADSRLATLEALANSTAGRYEYEKSRSVQHDSQLLAIVAQASEFNGSLEFSDGGVAEGLRKVVQTAFTAMRDAKNAAVEYHKSVKQARQAYTRRNQNDNR